MNDKEILLANPRGFWVERAIEIVERALVRFGAPIYVRHEVVQTSSWSMGCAPKVRCSSRISPTCRPETP